jgi:CubicO group peptidase (beta-lactamase class C family)
MATGLVPLPAGYAGPRALPDFLKTVEKEGDHGTGFQYKSVDTEVIGWVLQRVTGVRFAELVSEKIWRNIGAEQDALSGSIPRARRSPASGSALRSAISAVSGRCCAMTAGPASSRSWRRILDALARRGLDQEIGARR